MKYNAIEKGIFLSRPNRFIAYVQMGDEAVRVHVKNTGRCKELLTEGATVYLEKGENPNRSTPYDLVAVEKGDLLVNMDSQAPNHAVEEWLRSGAGGRFGQIDTVIPEKTIGNSRIDFFVRTVDGREIFLEVKGVTLEHDGVVSFPDAPTERGVKHLMELADAVKAGYEAYVLFLIQMKPVRYFLPNEETQPEFARALQKAKASGVGILVYDTEVSPDSMTVSEPVPTFLSSLEAQSKALLDWYDQNHREMAWRSDPKPYHVWLSEIMLQQTRVEAVREYYDRFLRELPTVSDLAKAPEEQLLKLWQGLGYYNRVRNLQKAAQIVVEQYGGELPGDYDALEQLPGIGSYTAGAISSIAFGLPYPVVDGNVLRILSRLRKDGRNITDAAVREDIRQELLVTMERSRPGDFNQALMELGATVCLPNGAPMCQVCPWNESCLACRDACWETYPVKDKPKARAIEQKTVLMIYAEDRILLHKRPEKGLLAGLYEFPMLEGKVAAAKLLSEIHTQLPELEEELLVGIEKQKSAKLKQMKHIFSHKEWHMTGYEIRMSDKKPLPEDGKRLLPEGYVWATEAELEQQYAVPNAFRGFLEQIRF